MYESLQGSNWKQNKTFSNKRDFFSYKREYFSYEREFFSNKREYFSYERDFFLEWTRTFIIRMSAFFSNKQEYFSSERECFSNKREYFSSVLSFISPVWQSGYQYSALPVLYVTLGISRQLCMSPSTQLVELSTGILGVILGVIQGW